jgi:hypothetical protein
VAAAAAAAVALGVGDEEALHDPADRRCEGSDRQEDVVGDEAIAVERERPSLLQVAEGLEARGVIPVDVEDGARLSPR